MRQVTHEWAGEPHASESIKYVDGVEVARNRALNPSFEAYPDPAVVRASSSIGIRGAEWFTSHGEQAMSVIASGNATSPWSTQVLLDPVPVEAGQGFAMLFHARQNPWNIGLGIRHYFRVTVDGGDAIGINPTSSYSALTGGFPIDNPYIIGFTVPEGYNRVEPGWEFSGTPGPSSNWTPPPAGSEAVIDGVNIIVAATRADALAQAEEYFDGDTEDYFLRIVFKVWANGKWRPIEPKAYVDGVYLHGGMS